MSYAAQNYGCMSRPEPEEEYQELQVNKVLAEELFEDKQWKEDIEEILSNFDDEDHKEFEEFTNMSLKESIEYWRDIVAEQKSDHDEDDLEFDVDANNHLKFV